MSVLRHVLQLYEITFPEVKYVCTYKTALRVWEGLDNYKLNTVCRHLNFEFKHHDAGEDAVACGKILLDAMIERNVEDVFQLCESIGMSLGRLFNGGYNPCRISTSSKVDTKNIIAQTDNIDPENEFFEKKIVFTGTLTSMARKDAMQKVVNVGGIIGDGVTEDTNFLVMGMQDYSKFADGKESNKTKKAKMLIANGKLLQVIDEDEFLRLMQI